MNLAKLICDSYPLAPEIIPEGVDKDMDTLYNYVLENQPIGDTQLEFIILEIHDCTLGMAGRDALIEAQRCLCKAIEDVWQVQAAIWTELAKEP